MLTWNRVHGPWFEHFTSDLSIKTKKTNYQKSHFYIGQRTKNFVDKFNWCIRNFQVLSLKNNRVIGLKICLMTSLTKFFSHISKFKDSNDIHSGSTSWRVNYPWFFNYTSDYSKITDFYYRYLFYLSNLNRQLLVQNKAPQTTFTSHISAGKGEH